MKRNLGGVAVLWILLAMPLAAKTAHIWVMSQDGTTIEVIDPMTNTIVQTIKSVDKPYGAVFSPDGSRAYVTTENENFLSVLDTKTGNVITKIALSGSVPNLPLITQDGKRVYVCIRHSPAGAVDVIDTSSLERIK